MSSSDDNSSVTSDSTGSLKGFIDDSCIEEEYLSSSEESFVDENPPKKRKLNSEGNGVNGIDDILAPLNIDQLSMSVLLPPPREQTVEEKQLEEELNKRKKEVDEYNKVSSCDVKHNIYNKVLLSDLPIAIKAKVIMKLDENVLGCSSDKQKIQTWVNHVLKLPFNKVIPFTNELDYNFLEDIRTKLDQHIYKMDNVKEEIIDFIINFRNTGKSNKILALKGPPGVGKTKICRALSEIMNLPLFQVSCGGLKDSSTLIGHDLTYVGSKPGKIVEIMQSAKCINPIIFLDEIDKMSQLTSEVYSVFTHMLDETQNNTFNDLYMGEITLDLSNVLFVTSFNNEELIDPIVLNRMKIIEIGELSVQDKIEIVKNFVLPECNYKGFIISDQVIQYIINFKTTPEPGMRNIKKNIETIIGKLSTVNDIKECTNRNIISKGLVYEKLFKVFDGKNITEKVVDTILTKKNDDESWRTMYI